MSSENKKQAGEKRPGYHSRKHSTSQPHEEARERYQAERGPDARQRKADEREALRAELTPMEQTARLDQRLGKGMGARRERARLQALIASQ